MIRINTFNRDTRVPWRSLAAITSSLMLSFALSAVVLHAQDAKVVIKGGEGLPDDVRAQIQELANEMGRRTRANIESHTARLTPGLVSADAKTGAATLELSNQSDDTLQVSLTAGTEPRLSMEETDLSKLPPGVAATVEKEMQGMATGTEKATPKTGNSNPLLADEPPSSTTVAQPVDVVDTRRSLAGWIKDLPAKVTLAPHEKKSITVHVAKPAQAAPGKYAAWIVAVTAPSVLDGAMTKTKGTGAIRIEATSMAMALPKNALQASSKIELLVE